MEEPRLEEYSILVNLIFGEKDSYQRSLETIKQTELFEYMKLIDSDLEFNYGVFEDEELISCKNSLIDLFLQSQKGKFIYEEKNFIKSIHIIILSIWNYITQFIGEQYSQVYKIQQEMGELNFTNYITENLIRYKDYLRIYEDRFALMKLITNITQFQIKDNIIQSDTIFASPQFLLDLFELFKIDSLTVSKVLFPKHSLFNFTNECLEYIVDKKSEFEDVSIYYNVMIVLLNNLKQYSDIQYN